MAELGDLSDEDLAAQLAEATGLAYESALRAVRSDDPELGRNHAVGVIEAQQRHRDGQSRLSVRRRSLRRASRSV